MAGGICMSTGLEFDVKCALQHDCVKDAIEYIKYDLEKYKHTGNDTTEILTDFMIGTVYAFYELKERVDVH
jgi:hypothetical protein